MKIPAFVFVARFMFVFAARLMLVAAFLFVDESDNCYKAEAACLDDVGGIVPGWLSICGLNVWRMTVTA
jgi:hypothetical protein